MNQDTKKFHEDPPRPLRAALESFVGHTETSVLIRTLGAVLANVHGGRHIGQEASAFLILAVEAQARHEREQRAQIAAEDREACAKICEEYAALGPRR